MQNAVAEGETRTISMHHIHTDESITITYKRDGRYDEAALEKLNWFLRDWRRSEETRMDPHLIDLVWEVQRETGTKEPISVVCGYRSPQTNAMLRHRSSGVARFSQHMLGKAMDFYIQGVPLAELRSFGLRLQRGGVGFYPESGSPFVHMDTGGIRMWPRMSREELVRVFPDGRTVHIPSDGRPLPGYALALAEIRKRGDTPSDNSLEAARNAGIDVGSTVAANEPARFNPFAKLLGLAKNGKADEEDDSDSTALAPAAKTPTKIVVAAVEKAAAKTVATARAAIAEAPKLIHTAALAPVQAPASPPLYSAATSADSTPNQVIIARGYWQGLPDTASAAQPSDRSRDAVTAALRARGTEVASADPTVTGAIGPWPAASQDRVPPALALSYAEQPGRDAPARVIPAMATETSAAPQGSQIIGQAGTTIAIKGDVERPVSKLRTATRLASAAVIRVTSRFDSPWMRAIVLSPSVKHFLTTVALGARDFTSLASLFVKPSSSVMMTFSSDPNLGLSQDHFSGSAVVFVSTVTYPTHTASLQ